MLITSTVSPESSVVRVNCLLVLRESEFASRRALDGAMNIHCLPGPRLRKCRRSRCCLSLCLFIWGMRKGIKQTLVVEQHIGN
jgi:hypothetical protein